MNAAGVYDHSQLSESFKKSVEGTNRMLDEMDERNNKRKEGEYRDFLGEND
jgi:hypothetical protein